MAELDGEVYALGGKRLKSVSRYSPTTNQWFPVPSMQVARSDATAVSCQGQLYIFGGFDGYSALRSAEVYNLSAKKWKLLPPMCGPRSGAKAAALGSKIFVSGGWDGTRELRSLLCFDVNDKSWTGLPDMITPRSNHALVVQEGKLLAVGGYDGTSTTADVESYDFSTWTWSPVGSLPTPRSGFCTAVVPAAAVEQSLRNNIDNKVESLDRQRIILGREISMENRHHIHEEIHDVGLRVESFSSYYDSDLDSGMQEDGDHT